MKAGVRTMQIIKVPKSVAEQLSNDERVIGKVSSGGVDYYATDQRLLRFTGPSRYQELDYAQLSITFIKGGIVGTIGSILVILLSLAIIVFPHWAISPENVRPLHFSVYLLCYIIGISFILMALIVFYGRYQISAPGFDKNEFRRWRIQRYRWGSGNADKFAKIVKERSGRA